MARTLSIVLALASLVGLTAPPGAIAAAGLDGGRVVAKPQQSAPAPANRSEAVSPLVAPPAACSGQESREAPAEAQEQAMRCMTDFARSQAGLSGLEEAEELNASARGKALDILRCDSFSHLACGREFTYWMKKTGYIAKSCWRAGENLAWGTGEQGTVRAIFLAWMRSPGHRSNILGDYSQLGVSVEVGALEGRAEVSVWTQHFGSRCEAPPAPPAQA